MKITHFVSDEDYDLEFFSHPVSIKFINVSDIMEEAGIIQKIPHLTFFQIHSIYHGIKSGQLSEWFWWYYLMASPQHPPRAFSKPLKYFYWVAPWCDVINL